MKGLPKLVGPVSRFPGELIWQVTRRRLEFLEESAARYGDFVFYRLSGMNFYLLSHPDQIREVLVTHDDAFTKGPALRRSRGVLGEGLLTSEGDFHKRQRRLSQPAFHPQRMEAYAPTIVKFATASADRWHEGQELNLHGQMMRLALEIVGEALFGTSVEAEVDEIGGAMDILVRRFTRTMSPVGRILDRLPLPGNFRLRRAVSRLHQTLDRFIAERRQADRDQPDTGRADLLSMLLRARDAEGDNSAMTDVQLRDECLTLFTAGHETTANALTFSFYLLGKNPDVRARLEQELETVLGGRVPTAGDLERLPFTRAVVSESMRLYPPAWGLARQAKRDVEIGGRPIPRDAVIILSQWVVHRDERWWPDALRFQPERWLQNDLNRPRWAYFPFGGGTRQCIGESFAWTEATLAIATIAQRWRVEPIGPAPELLATITLRPKRGLKVRLVGRSG